jgi:hypothetical protein
MQEFYFSIVAEHVVEDASANVERTSCDGVRAPADLRRSCS